MKKRISKRRVFNIVFYSIIMILMLGIFIHVLYQFIVMSQDEIKQFNVLTYILTDAKITDEHYEILENIDTDESLEYEVLLEKVEPDRVSEDDIMHYVNMRRMNEKMKEDYEIDIKASLKPFGDSMDGKFSWVNRNDYRYGRMEEFIKLDNDYVEDEVRSDVGTFEMIEEQLHKDHVDYIETKESMERRHNLLVLFMSANIVGIGLIVSVFYVDLYIDERKKTKTIVNPYADDKVDRPENLYAHYTIRLLFLLLIAVTVYYMYMHVDSYLTYGQFYTVILDVAADIQGAVWYEKIIPAFQLYVGIIGPWMMELLGFFVLLIGFGEYVRAHKATSIIQSRIYDDMEYMNNKIIEFEMDGEEKSK